MTSHILLESQRHVFLPRVRDPSRPVGWSLQGWYKILLWVVGGFSKEMRTELYGDGMKYGYGLAKLICRCLHKKRSSFKGNVVLGLWQVLEENTNPYS